jgi:hypothetical protein
VGLCLPASVRFVNWVPWTRARMRLLVEDVQSLMRFRVPERRPTSLKSLLVQAAVQGIRSIYQLGFDLVKASVMLLELQPASRNQHELDLDLDLEEPVRDRDRLMQALDFLNDRYGRGTLAMASAGMQRKGDGG